jgi:hypothetical protein
LPKITTRKKNVSICENIVQTACITEKRIDLIAASYATREQRPIRDSYKEFRDAGLLKDEGGKEED